MRIQHQIQKQHEPVLAGDAVPPVFLPADLAAYADDLRRYARRQVRDAELAEDAVQDALVAALVSLPAFQGKSSLKTWLLGILAHKIQDVFRRETRYVRLPSEEGDGMHLGAVDPAGVAAMAGTMAGVSDGVGDGAVAQTMAGGGALVSNRDPERELARRRFGACLGLAIERLPTTLREVFQLRELEGLATPEVCRRLGISEGNCWVRLHRARKMLSAQLVDHY